MGLTLFCARSLCIYKNVSNPKKRGPKFKLSKANKLSIKRTFNNLSRKGEKINCPKIIEQIGLQVSPSTVQRHLTKQQLKYKKAVNEICLTEKHKKNRIRIIEKWISSNHRWENTIFSDEKRFSLDGPDDWRTYVTVGDRCVRNKRQCHGGSIMVWLMCIPNGLISYKIVGDHFKSGNYIDLLKKSAVPIMKLNLAEDFHFQQDNSPVHTAALTKKFMKEANINVIEWPAKSPDLNIVEDIWKMLSDKVYDGPQFVNKAELIEKINDCIYDINCNCRSKIVKLYDGIRSRLVKVLLKNGNLYNK